MMLVAANQNGTGKTAYKPNFSGDNEWYTPARYIELARSVLGQIDVDPASNDFAQQTVRATTFYTIDNSGLDKPWHGRVWMNPPYGRGLIGPFISKLVAEYRSGRCSQAVVLTNNATDTAWFASLFGAASAVCFTRGRIPFYSPTRSNGATLPMGQLFAYLGDRPAIFSSTFEAVGHCMSHANQNVQARSQNAA
ncbi:MAG: DNA N-6-adenine-methyltransferase [Mesorhizobium sp.]